MNKFKHYLKLSFLFLLIIFILPYTFSISEICILNSDCQKYNYCSSGRCKHIDLFPITIYQIVGMLSIFFAAALSNAGGIGGGTLFLPVLFLIMNFYGHEAIPLSKIVIFFGSLSSFLLNLKIKHPSRNTKAIDYNLIIMICPNLLFGTILGVTFNKMLPNAIIVLLLSLLLFYNTYKTLKAFLKQLKEEKHSNNLIEINLKEAIPSDFNSINKKENNIIQNNKLDQELIIVELKKEKTFFRWEKFKYIIIPFIILIFCSILRESSLIEKCSFGYWFIFIIFFIFAIGINFIVYNHVQKEFNYRQSINYPYDYKDIIWDPTKTINIGLLGLVSGLIAGTIGIGGGVVLGPFLLDLGIHPIVSTVTTNFLVLLTSSSTSFQFILNKMLNYQYAIFSVIFSSLGSFSGTLIVHKYMESSGRQSVIIFALFLVICISAVLLPLTSINSIIIDINKGLNIFTFHSPCEK